MCLVAASDHFLHNFSAGRLQWTHAASGQKPHAFVLVAAINNVHAIARYGVMKRGAGVLGDKFEEGFSPRIVRVTEQLVAKFLQFFDADRANRLGQRFATLFVEILKIECFERHGCNENRKQTSLSYSLSGMILSRHWTLVLFFIAKVRGN